MTNDFEVSYSESRVKLSLFGQSVGKPDTTLMDHLVQLFQGRNLLQNLFKIFLLLYYEPSKYVDRQDRNQIKNHSNKLWFQRGISLIRKDIILKGKTCGPINDSLVPFGTAVSKKFLISFLVYSFYLSTKWKCQYSQKCKS